MWRRSRFRAHAENELFRLGMDITERKAMRDAGGSDGDAGRRSDCLDVLSPLPPARLFPTCQPGVPMSRQRFALSFGDTGVEGPGRRVGVPICARRIDRGSCKNSCWWNGEG